MNNTKMIETPTTPTPRFGRRCACLAVLLTWAALFSRTATAAEITMQRDGDDVVVEVDGKPFTRYDIDNGPKPILFPVVGPGGQEMTRAYPMRQVEGERQDHPHHRSIWFTHGDVGGVDFWSESDRSGKIKHREYVDVNDDDDHTIKTINDWYDADGKKICEDVRTVKFAAGDNWRSIDYDVTITASEGPVKFGDTKEGAMGIRVPTAIDVDNENGGGHIRTSEGLEDRAAWGKRASWVDYYGDIDGQTVGVAMLNHPSSFRYPTYWHVRTYGLFAANPFGLHDFLDDETADGSFELAQGETLTMRHRLIFHLGDTTTADIAAEFERYAAEK
ncbi:MAG: PmoA family protein [Planctomycetales bacterium]|nr:PmoA family protein [Planctomycetales bacterium]